MPEIAERSGRRPLMLERASALTPSDRPGEALQRAVDAAYLHFASGDDAAPKPSEGL